MRYSKLAVWSFVLVLVAYLLLGISFIFGNNSNPMDGIFILLLSFSLAGLIGMTGLILSIISLKKINKEKLKGKGFAISTIILSLVLILGFLYISR